MSNLPIALPPGIFRQGTEYQARGRWRNSNLVRWYGRQLGPILGWRLRAQQTAVTGAARAILPWRTTAGARWLGIGTHSHLYAQGASGTNFDITPPGFIVGQVDQSSSVGFGSGAYGVAAYGTPRQDTGTPVAATVWDLDAFGNYLVGCSPSDGTPYVWELDTSTPAQAMAGAPSSCSGLVVSQEGFVLALGAGGDPRKVAWADQGSTSDWMASTTSQAGDIDLVTQGELIKGVRLEGAVLLLTDIDAHLGQYVGLPSVYRFEQIGEDCGAISKGCVAGMGAQAAWWSPSGFWFFDGQSVSPLVCDVYDYLLSNLNQAQRTKITAWHNGANGEIWWHYPSSGSAENDSYVFWDYRKTLELGAPVWGMGKLARLCGCGEPVFSSPLAMGPDGLCYEHEVGYAYDGAQPWARSGPIQLGNGDYAMRVTGIIPDEATAGQATVAFYGRSYPNAPEALMAQASFDGGGFASVRFEARQVSLLVTFTAMAASRMGEMRLMASPGGRR